MGSLPDRFSPSVWVPHRSLEARARGVPMHWRRIKSGSQLAARLRVWKWTRR